MSTEIHQLDVDRGILRLVQVTDTHLKRQQGGSLLGLNTDYSLQHVLDLVLAERPGLDMVLATGDISDQGSKDAYVRARDYFAQLPAQTFWLAGNHDDRRLMEKVLGQNGRLVRVVEAGDWQIVLLDSQVAGEVGGSLGQEELAWLESCLRQASSRGFYSLICLHHQPVAMGSAWIDQQQVTDGEDFFAIIDNFPLVRGVLWGHVHQQLDSERNGVKLMSTPSTCVQFAPRHDEFKVDDKSPGYRWLDLLEDGSIQTGISRVEGVDFKIDLESRGYQ